MKTVKNIILFTLFACSIALNAQSKTFEVEVKGHGDPIVLLPGFTCTGEVWDDLVASLSKTNECHIFTFAGFGDVPPVDTPWLSKIKNSLSQYISDHKLDRTTIIGHSLGGTLGLWLAAEENASFNKVIVVDALPSTGALMMPNFNSETIVYDNPYNERLLKMDTKSFELMATQMASAMSLNKEKHPLIKDWMVKADRKTYVYGYTDLLKLDLRETIAKITVPVTILAATQPYGEDVVKKTYETQYKNLENYTIEYAKDSAHFIMFDQPEWLLSRVKEELQ